jgi:hypothetical protein
MSSPNVLESTGSFDKLEALSFPTNDNLSTTVSSNGSDPELASPSTENLIARRSRSVGESKCFFILRLTLNDVRKMVGGFEAKEAPDKQKLIEQVRASLTLLKQRISKGSKMNAFWLIHLVPVPNAYSAEDVRATFQNREKFNNVVRLPHIEKKKPVKKPFAINMKENYRFAYLGRERTKPVLKLPNIHNPTRIPILRTRYSNYYHTFPKDRVHNHIFVLQSWLEIVSKSEESVSEPTSVNEPVIAEEPKQEIKEEQLVVSKPVEPEKPPVESTTKQKVEQLKKKYSGKQLTGALLTYGSVPSDDDGTRFPPLRPSTKGNHPPLIENKKKEVGLPRYCSKCGAKFPGEGSSYRFCGACGQERKWREPHTIYQHYYSEPRVEERVR